MKEWDNLGRKGSGDVLSCDVQNKVVVERGVYTKLIVVGLWMREVPSRV